MEHVTKSPSPFIPLALAVSAACGGGEADATDAQVARRAQTAALEEMAQGLLLVEDSGGTLGARFVASLDQSADGEPLVRVYADSPAPAIAANDLVDRVIGRNQGGVEFLFADTTGVRRELQQMMLEVYREQFTGLDFVLTPDPTEANVFVFETTLTLNPRRSRPEYEGREIDAFTVAATTDPPISIIALNTGDEQAFGETVAEGTREKLEGVFLNEMMNALGTYDLQDLDFLLFSDATRRWVARQERDHGAGVLDRFTITDSTSWVRSPVLLEMDLILVRRVLEEAALLKETALLEETALQDEAGEAKEAALPEQAGEVGRIDAARSTGSRLPTQDPKQDPKQDP